MGEPDTIDLSGMLRYLQLACEAYTRYTRTLANQEK